LTQNDAGHQVTGINEEDVDANEATAETRHAEVVEHFQRDGPGAQAIDVLPRKSLTARLRLHED